MQDLKEHIKSMSSQAQSIGIMSHINPDGDGFCASLALQRFLRSMNYDSSIIIDSDDLAQFDYLCAEAKLCKYDPDMCFDLLFVLDCNHESRLGERAALTRTAQKLILIDHHRNETHIIPATYSYVNTTHASTGVILGLALQTEIENLNAQDKKFIANCLYTTILNDTNNFRNLNTNAEVYSLCAILKTWGLVPGEMYQAFFENYSPLEMKLIGKVLASIDTELDGNILLMDLTLEMLAKCNASASDVFNMTRWVQGLQGVKAIIYFREEAPLRYRISLRSPILDVQKIAVLYGGGGHKNASGFEWNGSYEQIKAELLTSIGAQLRSINALI